MTIEELYQRLIQKDFSNPATGNLFFPVYLYLYPAENEIKIRKEIVGLKNRLARPNEFLDATVIDIFDEFLQYLEQKPFGKKLNRLQLHLQTEESKNPGAEKLLKEDANGDDFMEFINAKVLNEMKAPGNLDKNYVFIHGFGKIFPYLRVNKFLGMYEQHINGLYKLIIFYPGTVDDNLNLFGKLNDDHHYRSIFLINEEKTLLP
jgi:hypothetical protein